MTRSDVASKIGLFIVSASLEHIIYSLQRGGLPARPQVPVTHPPTSENLNCNSLEDFYFINRMCRQSKEFNSELWLLYVLE